MKLDKLFQSLLLTGAVVVLISTPARSEANQGESSSTTVGESRFKDTVEVRFQESVNSKSPVLTLSNRKHRNFQSQVASSLPREKSEKSNRNIIQLSEIEQVSQSAELLVQSPVSSEIIQVTGVQTNATEQGVEVILQTTQGEQLQITNRSAENNFIADIPNAQLRLPSGDAFTFSSENPIEGISEITVINLDANTIRMTVAGETGLPTVELFDSNEGLVFALTPVATAMQPEPEQPTSETPQDEPSAQGDEQIELIVTGQQDGYRVRDSAIGTRTDTPLRDIPQSIQVIPQEVLRDQNAARLEDALRNVPGVTRDTGIPGAVTGFTIRGFSVGEGNNSFLRDGLPDRLAGVVSELPNIERVEVLRGPASILFGSGSPGGTINLVTKQPLREPFYAVDATVGNYNFYRGAIDLSGPLNESRTLLYRLNASYRNSDSSIDFFDSNYLAISPVLSWAISERTNLTFDAEYVDTSTGWYSGIPAFGTIQPNPNGQVLRSRNFSDPSERVEQTISRIGYRLEHKLNDDWSIRNVFRATFRRYQDSITLPTSLEPDNRTLNRIYREYDRPLYLNFYVFTTNLIGNFSTGSIEHELLVGFDLDRETIRPTARIGNAAQIDIFNPEYNGQRLDPFTFADLFNTRNSLGIYVQNQATLTDNLKLLLGVRFDIFEQQNRNLIANTRINQSGDAFSPRVGIVYQPVEPISLYASYTRSFDPAIGTTFDGGSFQPGRGTQYEVGVKADLNDRLSATLAFYNITLSNVLTADPTNPGFDIQTGEQRSRGVELNIGGEILPGWNVIAGYAYTDARITKDNTFAVNNRLNNTPENAFNLWTTYQIQQGSLQGLGLGLGLFFVGERQGDLANTFEVPSYLRTDAAIFYQRDRLRAALNFRNLFNVSYFENAFNNVRLYSGEPFTVQGTISWQF